jgi:hypothetical protein
MKCTDSTMNFRLLCLRCFVFVSQLTKLWVCSNPVDLIFMMFLGLEKNTHHFLSPKNYFHFNIQNKTDNQSTNLQNYNVVQYILFTDDTKS